MRGFPLMNLLAVGAILLALMVPLLRVDRPQPVPSSSSPAVVPQQSGTPVMVLLRFVHAPVEASLTVGGKVIPLRGAGLERQGETSLTERGQALEMEFKAAWPPGSAATMVEMRAAPDGMPEQQQNIWADAGSADEIVRFMWRTAP
jgi:hypothetical protein